MPAFDPDHDPDRDGPPLDPAAERVRRRMARLLMLSGGIMVLGLVAVFSAIVYRVGAGDGPTGDIAFDPSAAPVEAAVAIPSGARLVDADLDGGRALLTIEPAQGAPVLVLVELASGRVIGRYALRPE